ncbi:DUOXA1 [Mytilus edulis]|uniref:DUOXA1 n=1 Tax=Mytilus edulis TaxID=6550 RepID=A0A8S3S188_MYTED|nr:DUOXA1 [Mytilus edulis]
MKGEPEIQLNETINYNEHFDWRWEQGRFGFGIFAGRFNREYREAQFRGLPLPILWIAEYFTFDGEGIRLGRHYRQAGWYSHIMMWLALPLWFLTIILFFVLLKYGAYFLMLTGGVMVIANILWSTIRNFNELEIPLASDHVLKFKYGGAYYVNLITGVLCVLLGAIIWLMDLRFPSVIASFFGVDVLQDEFDDATVEEDTSTPKSVKDEPDQNGMEMRGMSSKGKSQAATADDEEEESDDEIYEAPTFAQQPAMMTSIKKQRFTKRVGLQAPRRRPPPPIPGEDPDEDYENVSRPDQDELFLVKWCGYPDTETTWEPTCHIDQRSLSEYIPSNINPHRLNSAAKTFEDIIQNRLKPGNRCHSVSSRFDLDVYRYCFQTDETVLLNLADDFSRLPLTESWNYRINSNGQGLTIDFPIRLSPRLHFRKIFVRTEDGSVFTKMLPIETVKIIIPTRVC